MNIPLTFALYVVVSVAALWFVLLRLWPRHKKSRCHCTKVKVLAGVVALLALCVPISGAPLCKRAFSFYSSPSLPFLGVVVAALCQHLFRFAMLRRSDWSTIWIFGAVAGSALYLHQLLFGAVDLYYWGWDRELSAWLLGSLVITFLAFGNRFGVLLLAGLLAYAVMALESRNCWDYVVDPIYWLVSVVVVAVRGFAASWRLANRLAVRNDVTAENGVPATVLQPIARAGLEPLGGGSL
jgi:hypothetical protein